jgi:hypothetical protein
MSDLLDDVLREMASAQAPDGFPVRVRARVEGDAAPSGVGMRVAAVAAALVLAFAGWLVVRQPSEDVTTGVERASVVPRGPALADHGGKDVEMPPVEVKTPRVVSPAGVARDSRAIRRPPSPPDHERALAALAPLTPVSLVGLVTDAVAVEPTEIAPLAQPTAIEIPALRAEEGERR